MWLGCCASGVTHLGRQTVWHWWTWFYRVLWTGSSLWAPSTRRPGQSCPCPRPFHIPQCEAASLSGSYCSDSAHTAQSGWGRNSLEAPTAWTTAHLWERRENEWFISTFSNKKADLNCKEVLMVFHTFSFNCLLKHHTYFINKIHLKYPNRFFPPAPETTKSLTDVTSNTIPLMSHKSLQIKCMCYYFDKSYFMLTEQFPQRPQTCRNQPGSPGNTCRTYPWFTHRPPWASKHNT